MSYPTYDRPVGLNDLRDAAHEANRRWYQDPKTGKPLPTDQERAEMAAMLAGVDASGGLVTITARQRDAIVFMLTARTRSKGELMMLMVSEIAEAMEGVRKNLKDEAVPTPAAPASGGGGDNSPAEATPQVTKGEREVFYDWWNEIGYTGIVRRPGEEHVDRLISGLAMLRADRHVEPAWSDEDRLACEAAIARLTGWRGRDVSDLALSILGAISIARKKQQLAHIETTR